MAMKLIRHFLPRMYGQVRRARRRIDAITVDGKIASDRSVMLILNVRRLNKNVKVFVLADKGLSEDKVRMMDYGADEFSTKPISMESLINKVNLNLLEAARSAVAS